MKKLSIFILLLPMLLYAKSFLLSNIALPQTSIQNLDPYLCDEACLQEHLEKEFIFSFLAHAPEELENEFLEKERQKHLAMLNIEWFMQHNIVKIALLVPYKKIGRYAASTANASFAYLMAKKRPFKLKSYHIENESYEEIKKVLRQIRKEGFYYVIAPLTQEGEEVISRIDSHLSIYFPTINKKDASSDSNYFYYGGIDYRAQSDILLRKSVTPLVIFHDSSFIGDRISSYQEQTFKQMTKNFNQKQPSSEVIKFSIPQRVTNLKEQLKENEKINGGSFFINTPIIKSGMIISQLTLYDANATNIFSTQTNYNPLLLSMTQYQDRKNMLIANSITQHKDVLIETNALLGNDIVYDWINYTTTVGVDYFSHLINGEKREYNIAMSQNQMLYSTELLRPSVSRFIPYGSRYKEE